MRTEFELHCRNHPVPIALPKERDPSKKYMCTDHLVYRQIVSMTDHPTEKNNKNKK